MSEIPKVIIAVILILGLWPPGTSSTTSVHAEKAAVYNSTNSGSPAEKSTRATDVITNQEGIKNDHVDAELPFWICLEDGCEKCGSTESVGRCFGRNFATVLVKGVMIAVVTAVLVIFCVISYLSCQRCRAHNPSYSLPQYTKLPPGNQPDSKGQTVYR